jgi:GNAT superfamily N-acetyltransferase
MHVDVLLSSVKPTSTTVFILTQFFIQDKIKKEYNGIFCGRRKNRMAKVIQLKTEQEWRQAFPVMKQLRSHLDEETFIKLINVMKQQGYELFALIENDDIQSVAGVAIQTNLYLDKHLFIYELVTNEANRSKGYGEQMINFLIHYAKENGCKHIALESGVQREDAHRFYEQKIGMKKASFSYRLAL